MKSFRLSPQLALALFILLQQTLYGQDKAYARKVVDTLASPQMHGRGYVMKGDKLAADYIAGEFRRLGLQPLQKNGSWFQEFSFPINTFPGRMNLLVQEYGHKAPRAFAAGEEFIMRSSSPSVKGSFPVLYADKQTVASEASWKAFWKKDLRKKFIFVDTAGVSDKKQLRLLEDLVRFPHDVKGILVPVKQSPIAGEQGHDCSRMLPLDLSQLQSSIPVADIVAGTDSITHITIDVQAKLVRSYKSQNVLAFIPGSQYPDSFIVFTAHYDHLGHLGKTVYFPGANDNASGVAMLLNLAEYYVQAANRPKCSIVFMAFGGEEVALLGSHFFAEFPLLPLKNIRFLVNMDILGTGDEGITVVNGSLYPEQFKTLQQLNAKGAYLPLVKVRGKAAISDHHFFTEKGVPAFYVYTLGGIKAYHDVCDRSQTLPLTKFDEIFRLFRDFTDTLDNR